MTSAPEGALDAAPEIAAPAGAGCEPAPPSGAVVAGDGAAGLDVAPSAGELALAARVEELERELQRLRERLARAGDPPGGAAAPAPASPGPEIGRLRAELEREVERRLAREREWLAYTRALDALGLPRAAEFTVELPPEELAAAEPAAVEPTPEELERARRGEAVFHSLRALLAIEGVRGLDLLEAGALGEGWTGPVVFRAVDDRGRLAGSVYAERLRLEGSRAGRTVTLVLEEGYETRGGVRFDFEGASPLGEPVGEPATRRILLPNVDPQPWVEALPELFGAVSIGEPLDDGRWSLAWVRLKLNELLRQDAAAGYWRLRELAGVQGGVLREVHLESLDREGRVDRRLFADRLSILPQEQGVLLLLEDGVQMRGGEKAPFLDGRYRIFLPRADLQEWRRSELPGLPASGGG